MIRAIKGYCAIGMAVCCLCAAKATIHEYHYGADGTTELKHVTHPAPPDPNADFVIVIDNAGTQFVVVTSDTENPVSEGIGRITVSSTAAFAQSVNLYIAKYILSSDASFYLLDSACGCTGWKGINDQRAAGTLSLKAIIAGNLTGSVTCTSPSTTHALNLNTLEVGQNITDLVSAQGGFFGVRCASAVPVGSTSPSFVSAAGISLVRASVGDIVGDVLAGNGFTIAEIEAPNGNIGQFSASDPDGGIVRIGTTGSAVVTVNRVTAKHRINARIIARGGIALLQTTSADPSVENDGVVTGSITVNRINDQPSGQGGLFDIAGDLAASITVTEELPSDALITIGNLFVGGPTSGPGITIQKDAQGSPQLKGQIIVGGRSGDLLTGRRQVLVQSNAGDILVGPPPGEEGQWKDWYYSNSSAELGGGSIGREPFVLNGYDCSPPAGAGEDPTPVMLQSDFYHGSNGRPIYLRFYGPVKSNGQGNPLTIERILYLSDENSKVDVTSSFVQVVNPSGAGGARTVKIVGKLNTFYYPGLYRIRCNGDEPGDPPGRLLCDTAKASFAGGGYEFYIRWDCDGNGVWDTTDIENDPSLDQNGDGLIDVCDRFGGCIADINGDGFVNADDVDLFDYVFFYGIDLADINSDGFVNADDADAFGAAFNAGC